MFVIETQGGESGYIATIAGLSIGAFAVYTPEDGISLKMLDHDIDHLSEVFRRDKGQNRAGKIILVNEKASKTYSVQIIADMIAEAGKGKFESRHGVPGHFQQGTIPSPMDRVRAVRFAFKTMEHLEKYAGMDPDEIDDDPMSTAVIGIKSSNVLFSAMESIEKKVCRSSISSVTTKANQVDRRRTGTDEGPSTSSGWTLRSTSTFSVDGRKCTRRRRRRCGSRSLFPFLLF